MHLYGTLLFQRSAFFFFVCMDEHCAIHRAFVCLCTLDCTPYAPNAPFGNADFAMFLEVPEKLSFGDAPYCTFAVFPMYPPMHPI